MIFDFYTGNADSDYGTDTGTVSDTASETSSGMGSETGTDTGDAILPGCEGPIKIRDDNLLRQDSVAKEKIGS